MRTTISDILLSRFTCQWRERRFLLEKAGANVEIFPYCRNGFYVMRNDALDRFGTQLGKRFTSDDMRETVEKTGLENITFSQTSFWTAVGYKK